ncbi:MAG TPA: histidine kinase N-terminal domain-containing protein, partial [Bacillales bacterium]|nr:histidine kinase N-terminal domain-containing protein [Bacillales bacterium]
VGGKEMLAETKTDLFGLFENFKWNILKDWNDLIIFSNDDPFKEQIPLNGETFFDIVVKVFNMPSDEHMKLIQKHAIEVAKERVKADINIGEFVYNVNLGRTLFHSYFNKIGLVGDDLQEAINMINSCFDKFLFHAVSFYADAKDKIILEKTQFIDSTHQDRLTLLGQMTSSFIHEFRNPLTSIHGFIQLLKADYPNMRYLDIISSELDQLNFRISQFLLLSKKELIGKEKVFFSLNHLIEEVLNFLYPSILDGKVKIIKDLSNDTSLFGYADEIRQVFINIIFNAIDVLGHHQDQNHPMIKIKSAVDDTHISIGITNNGLMIPEELQKTIFEPFFTTKKLGTGLGLFVCKEIIEKHKGELTCHSTPKKTTFTIKLPIASSNEG